MSQIAQRCTLKLDVLVKVSESTFTVGALRMMKVCRQHKSRVERRSILIK